jgi:hypothetical protein
MNPRERAKKMLNLVKSDLNSYIEYQTNNKHLMYGTKNGVGSLISKINNCKINNTGNLRILLVTDDILLSNIVILYGIISNQFIYIVPKNKGNWFISNSILSLDINLIIGNISNVNTYGIPVINGINYAEEAPLNMSKFNIDVEQYGGVYVLSPGSFDHEKYYFVSYETMIRAMENYIDMDLRYKPYSLNNIIIIGRWEQLFAFYSIMPILMKPGEIKRLVFCNDGNIEKMYNIFRDHGDSYKQVIISPYDMRKIWDHSLLEVNKRKFVFKLNEYNFFKSIIRYITAVKIEKFFTKKIRDVHIINDDMGTDVLDVLRTSKITFTSSYGTLEVANFIAYKHNALLQESEFGILSGGELPTKHELNFEIKSFPFKEEGNFILRDIDGREVDSNDVCAVISLPDDKEFLAYFGKNSKLFFNDQSEKMYFDLFRKTFKDSLLIRDVLIYHKDSKIILLIEPRRWLLDMQHISFNQYTAFIKSFIAEISERFNITVGSYAVISFNAIKNNIGNIVLHCL